MFDKPTKRRNEGFMHKVPGWMKGTFQLCMSQLDKCRDDNSRFMSNMNDKRRTRTQNMGEHALSKMAKELAVRLGKDPKNYTAKSFRRSAATQLAEAGMSVVGLQMAGNWKSTTTALEHMEHSNKSCNYRVNMLDGEDMESPLKKKKCINDANAVSSTSEGKGEGVAQNNCAFYSKGVDSLGST